MSSIEFDICRMNIAYTASAKEGQNDKYLFVFEQHRSARSLHIKTLRVRCSRDYPVH